MRGSKLAKQPGLAPKGLPSTEKAIPRSVCSIATLPDLGVTQTPPDVMAPADRLALRPITSRIALQRYRAHVGLIR